MSKQKKVFKAGDYVRCIYARNGNETVGRVYKVSSYGSSHDYDFYVEEDDFARPNCYQSEHFELANEKTSHLPDYL